MIHGRIRVGVGWSFFQHVQWKSSANLGVKIAMYEGHGCYMLIVNS